VTSPLEARPIVVGDKLELLRAASALGCTVVLCFIGLESPELSDERVAMHVTQGGHHVPKEKLVARYPRPVENLRRAIRELPHVLDNSDLRRPFRKVAVFEAGRPVKLNKPRSRWQPWR